MDWWQMGDLTFEAPDMKRFRCLQLAYDVMRTGGTAPCVLNAANEVVNLAFRRGQCGFLQMADVIEETLQRMPLTVNPTMEDYLQCDAESRRMAASILGIS